MSAIENAQGDAEGFFRKHEGEMSGGELNFQGCELQSMFPV